MIVTKYICDNCKAEQDTPDQMWNIGIVLSHYGESFNSSGANIRQGRLWCRKCVEQLGLLPLTLSKPDEPTPKEPSFEEIIRQIIREEIEQSQEGR